MLEGHCDGPPRIVEPDLAPAQLPRRSPQQALEQLNERHAAQLEERPPDLFHVPDAPQKWRHLHRVLTREEPET